MTRDPIAQPHPDRLSPRHSRYREILDAHAAAVAGGEPGYVDPDTGYFVFTAVELLERGPCCESGCRHCPFIGGDAVPPTEESP